MFVFGSFLLSFKMFRSSFQIIILPFAAGAFEMRLLLYFIVTVVDIPKCTVNAAHAFCYSKFFKGTKTPCGDNAREEKSIVFLAQRFSSVY